MARPPEYYPIAFHEAVRRGGSVILAENLPWTVRSARNRFYGFLAALRDTPGHPLHACAFQTWSVNRAGPALVISLGKGKREAGQLGTDATQVLKKLLAQPPQGG